MTRAIQILGLIIVLISILTYFWDSDQILSFFIRNYSEYKNENKKVTCITNVLTKQNICQVDCSQVPGHFSLPGMKNCHPWLTCDEIYSEVHTIKSIGEGFVKNAMLAKWQGYEIVLNVEKTRFFKDDFAMNIERHQVLNPSKFISQFIGSCNDSYAVQYYPFKQSENMHNILNNLVPELNTIGIRFSLCIDYVRILNFLHNHYNGIFVTCDSNSVHKISQQYLLTDDFHLILNDLDSVAINSGSGIVCGTRMPYGDLIAPEQIWPHHDKPYNYREMLPYGEKIDIWRIPDMCEYFLGDLSSDIIKFSLINTHKKCKLENPEDRPTAAEVLKDYIKISEQLNFNISHL